MSRKRSSAVDLGPGAKCPTCNAKMRRRGHPSWWSPRPGQPFYFKYWDSCYCGHLQHYEEAKVYAVPPQRPQRELTPEQLAASSAVKAKCSGMSSKRRREWLAEQMGIEERYAIISEFDAVECATVLEICAA